MKTSLIVTVLNEEKSIVDFLDSIKIQSVLPDEIVVVDGGSNDQTFAKIKNQKLKINNHVNFKILVKKGNRSVGRNTAIKSSTGDIIVCSDAGCILDKNWIKNIIKNFNNKDVDVVAGYYKGLSKTDFEKALIPFALVMEDKVSANNFLPSTRSVAFRKKIWKKIGGFNEGLNNNEDYEFSKRLRKTKAKIVFANDAIVYWKPRENFKEAFVMFYRFALGDIESGIIRPKVVFIITRYLIGFIFLILSIYYHSFFLAIIIFLLLLGYTIWAGWKNHKYVDSFVSLIYLIILQFLSDSAVISGTISGFISRLGK